MQFKVPQDVLRPDKIVGFLTLRQLIIVALGGGLAYSLYIILSKQYFVEVWLPPTLFIALITCAFAFISFHDMQFEKLLLAFIEYKFRAQKRTWQKTKGDSLISVFDTPIIRNQKSGQVQTPKVNEQDRRKQLEEISKAVDSHASKMAAPKN